MMNVVFVVGQVSHQAAATATRLQQSLKESVTAMAMLMMNVVFVTVPALTSCLMTVKHPIVVKGVFAKLASIVLILVNRVIFMKPVLTVWIVPPAYAPTLKIYRKR